MYETNQNQGCNLLLQNNWQCLQDSQRGRYLKMDCLQVGQESQDWVWIWYHLNQRIGQKIYQTSSHPYQINRKRKSRYCQFLQYHPFRSQKNQTTAQSGFICYDCAQVLKEKNLTMKRPDYRRPLFQNGAAMRPRNTTKLGYLQMDTKHVTPELSGLGFTCFEYAAIDIVSRYKLAVLLPEINDESAALALEFFLKWFPFEVKYTQTDNGLEYQRSFEETCHKHNIEHYLIHKNSPNENAVIERSFRTDQDEFYYWLENAPEHIGQLNEWLQTFINKYNTWRPHQALDYKTPSEVVKMLQMS